MSMRERSTRGETEDESNEHSLSRMLYTDLSDVLAIENACFSDPWPEFAFLQALASSSCYLRVVKKDHRVIGYLIGYVSGPETHIANVAVDPPFRRQGIAKQLLLDVLGNTALGCNHAILDVRESNEPAIKLYLGLGFRIIGRRPRYYRHPVEDALVMRIEMPTGSTDEPE
ncbi:MAG: ribosomal-protein-alanine N-acetyltransferase [Acidobacteria bacterium]|nr:MAG: ribosomal-protein-alanine N-acetyltransferase [Acidobacteriota bacterium]